MKHPLQTLACAALLALSAVASANTLDKVKSAGAITMGVRDSSGALSYTLGDGKYVGFHVEVCQRIIGNVDPAPKGTVWGPGVILDPDDGREYRLEMDWRSGAQELKLRGYWGPFWRTQVWRRPAGAG